MRRIRWRVDRLARASYLVRIAKNKVEFAVKQREMLECIMVTTEWLQQLWRHRIRDRPLTSSQQPQT